MNIQNFFKPVKLVDSDCEVEGECSDDETFQNIYQPTLSDKEFIASDDEDDGEGKRRFLEFVQDEQDAKRWREHCAQQKTSSSNAEGVGLASPPKKQRRRSIKSRGGDGPSPKRPPKPTPSFLKPSSAPPKLHLPASIPTFLIRTRKRRRREKKECPVLVQKKKKRRKVVSPARAAAATCFFSIKKKGRRTKSLPKKQPVAKKGNSPAPYRSFDDRDPYFGDDNDPYFNEEDLPCSEDEVSAVANNFCLVKAS